MSVSVELVVVLVIVAVLVFLVVWRIWDHRADRREMDRLLVLQPAMPATFSASMVDNLPEPARRYFRFAIADGTPLLRIADLRMAGRFSLGTKDKPNYIDIQARQVLAAPHGFIWKMSRQRGQPALSGSDSTGWTRFWLAGLVPVARGGGDADLTLSAFGRYAAEAVFWTPSAVLPGREVSWAAVDEDTARMTMRHNGMVQSVDLTVASDGSPVQVAFDRWSNANPDKAFRMQRFGGYLSEFRRVQGFCIPTHVEAGNFFGSDVYFPFFVVDVTDVSFPAA